MKTKYDRSVNSAYILLEDKIYFGRVKKTYPCDINEVGGMINLNFDAEGRLVGIEVLDASTLLPKELLDQAEIVG
jgi:uncharacterized protein YuzE